MTDLLLITDVPRLRKLFSKLADDSSIRLRTASSLEQGAEELLTEKPAMVFVQTHLSGLSAEILLMHLKKQLGRRRTRFVLLSPPGQTADEVVKLYQGHIDSSLKDDALVQAFRAAIATLPAKGRKAAVAPAPQPPADPAPPQPQPELPAGSAPPLTSVGAVAPAILEQPISEPTHPVVPSLPPEEPNLVEQGVIYAPKPKISVYSEFTSSFDSAVSNMASPQPGHAVSAGALPEWHEDAHPDITDIEPASPRSARSTFLLWLAPVVVAVVVVTVLQNRKSPSKTVDVAPKAPAVPTAVQPAPAVAPAAPVQVASPAPTRPPVAEADARLSDRAVMSDIAASRDQKEKTAKPSVRPSELPDFIPRSGLDKAYGVANPGWERYKGHVTEFKVYREGKAIKAIQVIDRGGKGVPESFMKAALSQLTKSPKFVQGSSEKKEGYEIQRGRVADNLKVVFYRDAAGGRLRAFVVTWL